MALLDYLNNFFLKTTQNFIWIFLPNVRSFLFLFEFFALKVAKIAPWEPWERESF